MLNTMSKKFKAAEKTLVSGIKSKAGRKGVKMYKEVKSNVLKPSLVKKTIGGFSRGIEKEREIILDKKYRQAVQEWRASMLRLALEMVDTIEFAMKKFGHSPEEAKAYADRALAKVLIIKERLGAGKYDGMIDDVQFAIDTFTSEIIAASGMGLLEQKFFNSCVNGAAEEDFEEDLDDELEEDFWDLDEELPENFEGTVEEYHLSEVYHDEDYREVVVVDEPKVEIIEDDEYRNTVRQRRITYLENLLIATGSTVGCYDDVSDLLYKLGEEDLQKLRDGEYDDVNDDDFYNHVSTDISTPVIEAYTNALKREEVKSEETQIEEDPVEESQESEEVQVVEEVVEETSEEPVEEVHEVAEVADDTVEPETASEAIEAAVKEVLEMDNEPSNGKYPAKKKGKKPANTETK